jgi:hypothetical protein
MSIVIGAAYDFFGRKIITGIALFSLAAVYIGLSFMTTLWPGFILMWMANGVCILPILNTPILVDYVSKESMGIVVPIGGLVQDASAIVISLFIILQK